MNDRSAQPDQHVLGVAPDRTLIDVIDLAVAELKRTDGAPRRVVAEGAGIRLIAEREALHGPFDSIVVKKDLSVDATSGIERVLGNAGLSYRLDVAEDGHELLIDPTGGLTSLEPVAAELSELIELPETWRVSGEGHRADRVSPAKMFRLMQSENASDLHMFPGSPPVLRINSRLRRADCDPLSAGQILTFLNEISSRETWARFEETQQCSFRYHAAGFSYCRVSAFRRAGAPHCTLRYLPERVPSFDDLQLPVAKMQGLAQLHDGLVLVTGMTGSGKSTTVAALIDWINSNRSLHILTAEDPVEYIHENRRSVISQREKGVDFESFTHAVHGAMRQDPDVIFVGEMRDAATVRAVIDAAATGHLVISTLHASTAAEAANRIVSFFEPVERDLVRLQLHECLRSVVSQRLVPKRDSGRVVALEFLFNDTKKISESLLTGDTRGLRIGMQQDLSESSIFEESLLKLLKEKLISEEDAMAFAPHPASLEQMRIGTWRPPALDSMSH